MRLADVGGRVEDLPLQIGEVDAIGVAERDRADAGGREELRGRRAEAAHADDERMRGRELLLRVRAELVEQDVPAVAEKLRVVHAEASGTGAVMTQPGGVPVPRRRKQERPARAGRFACRGWFAISAVVARADCLGRGDHRQALELVHRLLQLEIVGGAELETRQQCGDLRPAGSSA